MCRAFLFRKFDQIAGGLCSLLKILIEIKIPLPLSLPTVTT
jgi:hypothetical protein